MATVGRAEVRIVADTRGFSRDAERKINRAISQVDVDSDPIRNGIAGALRDDDGDVDRAVTRTATRAGGRFIEQLGVVLQGGISRRAAGGLGASLLAVLGPAVLTAGTLIGGLLITGLGAGIAGLGAFFAAQNERVREEFSGVFTSIANDMGVIARPLEDSLLALSGIIGDTFDPFRVALGQAFEDLAPALTIFFRDLGRAFEAFAPAIGPITDAFIRILEELGPELANDVFPDLADALINLANAVGDNAGTFVDLLTWFLSIPESIINFIAELVRLAGWFADNPEAIVIALGVIGAAIGALVAGPIGALVGALVGIGIAVINLREQVGTAMDAVIETISNAVSEVGDFFAQFGRDAQATWDRLRGGVSSMAVSVGGFFRDIGRGARVVLDNIRRNFNNVVNFFQRLPGRIAGAAGDLWGFIWDGFRSAINSVIRAWNGVSFPSITVGGQDPLGPFGPSIPRTTIGGWNLPNIPYLQSGGLIERAGVARVGEAGPETVFLPQGAQVDPRPAERIVAESDRLPDEFEATATIDLGNDIQRAVNLTFRRVATNARAGQRRTAVAA